MDNALACHHCDTGLNPGHLTGMTTNIMYIAATGVAFTFQALAKSVKIRVDTPLVISYKRHCNIIALIQGY